MRQVEIEQKGGKGHFKVEIFLEKAEKSGRERVRGC